MIDHVSQNLIKIALYLDQKQPGIVSEIWIDEAIEKELRAGLPTDTQVGELVQETNHQINKTEDKRRQQYLLAMLESLSFQIEHRKKQISYTEFSKNAFGYQIERVTEAEIAEIEDELKRLESKLGTTRKEVYKKHSLPADKYRAVFEEYVTQAKDVLPAFISDFPDKGFEFEVVTGKPWSAFNSHIAPFRSRLTINSDVSFSKLDLYRLAFHEAYGGHHSELSHKDAFLTDQGRGEHGIIITFSPQTFVSEAIAEGVYVLLGGLDKDDPEQLIGWYYDRLMFALQNLATFFCFDDKLTRDEIDEKLKPFGITDKSRENILNFSLDPLFGKYAPVYYTAFNFLSELFEQTDKKDELIKTLFTQPCTPKLLEAEFEGK